ncbi:acetyl-CoA carboxylase biotin carboxylase subunit family protein [Sporosarcina sp.]|uniref:ATP-grasp domain-containing protein n=1 Tax=Sporosarcina sp. TaxID=49982 RepID=UPI00263210C8|nr:ATP-grasp domain-containing protein [Sporosarcina sp.]
MKKVMFLGGDAHQVSAIQYAKKQGYYTILCDYLEGNLGKSHADEFYCVSTTDKQSVLEIAEELKIDGIVAFAPNAALETAAYVGEKMNLPFYSTETVLLLSNKSLFRRFLKDNGFNYPKSKSFTSVKDAEGQLNGFQFPLIIKPVDSSGSRGIVRIDCMDEIEQAFENALSNSRIKVVIIEEYIEMTHECMIGGDIVVINGEIKFFGIINGHRDVVNNPCIPLGNSYPTIIENERIVLVRQEIQKIIDLLGIKFGAMNIDVIFGENERPYIIEINARNGGNMVSSLLRKATGVDLVGLSVEMAVNNKDYHFTENLTNQYFSTYYLRSYERGRLLNIDSNEKIKENIIKKYMYKAYGDEVDVFDGLDKIIGIYLFKFSDLNEMKNKMDHMDRYIDVQVVS